jgi:chemotaxis protein CheZ
MPEQRKVFRIEESMGAAPPDDTPRRQSDQTLPHAQIIEELKALRADIARMGKSESRAAEPAMQIPAAEARKLKIELDVIGEAIKQTKEEIVTLQNQGFDNSRMARVTGELQAVVAGTEQATNQILKSAEQIDEVARNLVPLLKNNYEKDLVQDIQDRITEIFEACNFQDLTGQRISKVVTTLGMVEDHLARMTEIWNVIERFNAEAALTPTGGSGHLLSGPKLDGDTGHTSQDDIDKLFH